MDDDKPRRMALKWREPLLRILEGHVDLLTVTENFPGVGRLGAVEELREFEKVVDPGRESGVVPEAVAAAVGVVVVVVVVAVAARPSAVTSEDLLRAKLLDVYGPGERYHLKEAIALVRAHPQLVQAALGIPQELLGRNFMQNLARVETALA